MGRTGRERVSRATRPRHTPTEREREKDEHEKLRQPGAAGPIDGARGADAAEEGGHRVRAQHGRRRDGDRPLASLRNGKNSRENPVPNDLHRHANRSLGRDWVGHHRRYCRHRLAVGELNTSLSSLAETGEMAQPLIADGTKLASNFNNLTGDLTSALGLGSGNGSLSSGVKDFTSQIADAGKQLFSGLQGAIQNVTQNVGGGQATDDTSAAAPATEADMSG